MKRTLRHALVTAAVLVGVAAGPAQASPELPVGQVAGAAVQDDNDNRDDRRAEDKDDDNGLWGLLGLLGLVGLVGLVRRGRRGDELAGPAAGAQPTRSDVITEAAPSAGAPQQYTAPPPGQRYRQP